MGSTTKLFSVPELRDLSPTQVPDAGQLDNIKAHLDLILLVLESLTGIGSEEVLSTAKKRNLEHLIDDRVRLWRLRQSNPLRKSSGGRKKLDVEEALAFVVIICDLAAEHQELIRRGVTLLEQMTEQNKPPHQAALLGDYLDKFSNTYQERMEKEVSTKQLSEIALKLLIDLLFYSSPQGHRRLWLSLLDRTFNQ